MKFHVNNQKIFMARFLVKFEEPHLRSFLVPQATNIYFNLLCSYNFNQKNQKSCMYWFYIAPEKHYFGLIPEPLWPKNFKTKIIIKKIKSLLSPYATATLCIDLHKNLKHQFGQNLENLISTPFDLKSMKKSMTFLKKSLNSKFWEFLLL